MPLLKTDDPVLQAAARGGNNLLVGDSTLKQKTTAEEALFKGVPAMAASILDTFSSSLGITDPDTINDAIGGLLGIKDFQQRNKDAIGITGDVVGLFLPATVAMKLMRGPGRLGQFLNAQKKGTLANRLMSSTRAEAYQRVLRMRDFKNAKNRGLIGIEAFTEPLRLKAKRQFIISRTMDGVKEGIAAEVAIFATMNSSQFIYPESFGLIDHLSFAALGVGISGTLPGLVARAITYRSVNNVAEIAQAKILQQEKGGANIQPVEFGNRPGERAGAIVANALSAHVAETTVTQAIRDGDDLVQSQFNRLNLQFLSNQTQLLKVLTVDGVPSINFKGITGTTQDVTKEALVKAGTTALENDKNAFAGVVAMFPISKIPMYEKMRAITLAKLQKAKSTKDAELALARDIGAVNDEAQLDITRLVKEADVIDAELKKVNDLQGQVGNQFAERMPSKNYLNADGSSPRHTDGVTVKWLAGTAPNNAKVTALKSEKMPDDPNSKLQGEVQFTIDDGLNFYVTGKGVDRELNRTDVIWTRSGNTAKDDAAFKELKSQYDTGNAGLLLQDMGKTYHFQTGQLGKPIFQRLSPAAQSHISNWADDPAVSSLRSFVNSTDPVERAIFDEIYAAYTPFRQGLRELKDAHDGTIGLFRGEPKPRSGVNPTANNDMQSFTSDLNVARFFADDATGVILKRRIPIDDIVMPIGGQGQEFEYIVMGNKQRVFESRDMHAYWTQMSSRQHSIMYTGMKQKAEKYEPKGKPTIFLDANSHWTKYTEAKEIIRQHPDAIKDIRFTIGDNTHTPDQIGEYIDWQIARGKTQEWNALQDRVEAAELGQIKGTGPTQEYIRFALLLPGPRKSVSVKGPNNGADPLFYEGASEFEQLLHEFRMQGGRDLSSTVPGGMPQLNDMLRSRVAAVDVFEIGGGQLNIPIASDLSRIPDQPSMFFVVDNIAAEQLTRADQIMEGTSRYMEVLHTLTNSAQLQGSVLVARISALMIPGESGVSNFTLAKNILGITEGSRRGVGAFVTNAFNVRDNTTFKALIATATDAQKMTDEFIDELYSLPNTVAGARLGRKNVSHTEVLQRATSNKAITTNLSTFFSARRFAWRLKPEAVKGEDGFWRFELSDTDIDLAFNQRIADRHFSDMALSKGDFMPVGVGDTPFAEVALIDEAYEVAITFREIGSGVVLEDGTTVVGGLLTEQNVVMRGLGRPDINRAEWWIPPKNFADQEIIYFMDEAGNNLKTITGRTKVELQRKLASPATQEFLREQEAANIKISQRSQQEVDQFYDIQSREFFRMMDAADPISAKGRPARGTAASTGLEDGAQTLKSSIGAILKQTQNVSKRTLALMFEPQLNYAKSLDRVGQQAGPRNRLIQQTVFQGYIDTLMGRPSAQNKGWIGDSYRQIETMYDEGMQEVWDKTQGKGIVGMLKSQVVSPDKKFAAVKEALGDFMPYDKASRFAEEQLNIVTPRTLKEDAAKLNWLTSTLVLRLFELGHPTLNFSGVITNAPAMVRALQRLPGESQEKWLNRTRLFGMEITDKNLENIQQIVYNPAKLFTNAIARGFMTKNRGDWADAANFGYLKQEVAEIHRVSTEPSSTFIKSWLNKGIDTLSYPSDKSEEVARGWVHMAGLIVADAAGLKGKQARHSFAHQFANDSIGDFRGSNRPGIFQGATGMPLGLFQTYMWNYYQRLFGYIENGQKRAAVVQIAMQASIFGAISVPGYDQFSAMFNGAHDGERFPSDVIRDNFGPGVADFALNGTISNIPKIFGQDGIALYSRGDANIVRIPSFFDAKNLPQASLMRSVYNIVGETVNQFREGGQISGQRMTEILGTWMINRPIARLMEVAAGVSIDKRGGVISNDTRTGLTVAAMFLGARTMTQQNLIEANYQNRQTEAAQRELRNRLNASLGPAFRSGKFNVEDASDAFTTYLSSGGNPDSFPRFLINAQFKARTEKSTLDFERFMRARDTANAMRLFNLLSSQKIDE